MNIIEIYYSVFGILILCHFLYLICDKYYFLSRNVYYLVPPIPFVRPLNTLLHNIVLLSLLPLGCLVVLNIQPLSLWLGLASLILFYLNFLCYSSWHHDIFLMILLTALSSGLALSADVQQTDFIFLIKFQVSSMYFFAAIGKLRYINQNNQIFQKLLLWAHLRLLVERNHIFGSLIGLSIIITESILAIIFWIPNVTLLYAGIVIGIMFHLSTVILIGRGRLFHATLPSIYILFLIDHEKVISAEILLIILVGIASCYFITMKYVFKILLKRWLPDHLYSSLRHFRNTIK